VTERGLSEQVQADVLRWERIRDDGPAQVTEVVELRYRPAR
jgi:hypothetical protein